MHEPPKALAVLATVVLFATYDSTPCPEILPSLTRLALGAFYDAMLELFTELLAVADKTR